MLIDIHVHASPVGAPPYVGGRSFTTTDELLAMLDERGIDKAVLLPGVSPGAQSPLLSSSECLEACRRHPDRLIPFCNIDPRMLTNSPRTDFAPMVECYKAHGCKGVGEMTANLPFDNAMMWNLFGYIEAARLPVTFHVATQIGGTYGIYDELNLPRFEETLRRFPTLTFLGHSQAFWSEISGDVTDATRGGYPKGPVADGGRIVTLMRDYPNVCGDLSAGSGYNAISRDPDFGYRFLTEFQDRLFFGTDICGVGQKTPIIEFLAAAADTGHISRDAYDKIAWRNAARLLGLDEEA